MSGMDTNMEGAYDRLWICQYNNFLKEQAKFVNTCKKASKKYNELSQKMVDTP